MVFSNITFFLTGTRALILLIAIRITLLYSFTLFSWPQIAISSCQRNTRLMTEQTIWRFFVQIASAVEHIHSKRIVHRGTVLDLTWFYYLHSTLKCHIFSMENKVTNGWLVLLLSAKNSKSKKICKLCKWKVLHEMTCQRKNAIFLWPVMPDVVINKNVLYN